MKYLYTLPVFLFTLFGNTTADTEACDNLYSKVTYALSHSKKALSATNFEHQMYYAERALTAMEKAEAIRSECSCKGTEEKSYEITKNLEKAIEPEDWDAGRFFTKKSKELINDYISLLDQCSNDTYVEEDTEEEINSVAIDETKKEAIKSNANQVSSYVAEMEQSLNSTNVILSKLIDNVTASQTTQSENANAIEQQRKLYVERTKKMLEDALKDLE